MAIRSLEARLTAATGTGAAATHRAERETGTRETLEKRSPSAAEVVAAADALVRLGHLLLAHVAHAACKRNSAFGNASQGHGSGFIRDCGIKEGSKEAAH